MPKPVTPIAAMLLAAALIAAAPPPPPGPADIVAAAPARDWTAISPSDLLVMDLAPDANGKARRVVIQLIAAPFSAGWVANIRTLAAARWWDGTAIVRVQDNYVVQWGDPDGEDAAKAKPLPAGLVQVAEAGYVVGLDNFSDAISERVAAGDSDALPAVQAMKAAAAAAEAAARAHESNPWAGPDAYAKTLDFFKGWPLAGDDENVWPIHCYGMVGVGRNLSPDTGTGAELYTVIGHAPRHLDRNIALVGRVIEGMEHLSSLKRGTGPLGFYETPEQRTTIGSIRLASELPVAEQPRYEYLSETSESFLRYAEARANRRDAFFVTPAGGADICNIPVPIRKVAQ